MNKRAPKKIPPPKKKAEGSHTNGKDDSSKIAFQRIKQMMYRNELSPGQKVRYKDLAKKLAMSPTPIVNALGRLSEVKLVNYELNRGYFIREIKEKEVRELFEVREALEVHIMPVVIKNATSEKLKFINDSFKEPIEIQSPYHRRIVLMRDLGLHLKIIEIAQNDVFQNLLKEVYERIYLGYKPEFLLDTRIDVAVKEHRSIMNAIEKKDIDVAIKNTRKHIKKSLEYMVKGIRHSEEAISNEYDSISGIGLEEL